MGSTSFAPRLMHSDPLLLVSRHFSKIAYSILKIPHTTACFYMCFIALASPWKFGLLPNHCERVKHEELRIFEKDYEVPGNRNGRNAYEFCERQICLRDQKS